MVLMAVVSAAAGRASARGVEDLGWLEGRWRGEEGGTASEEQWTSVEGGALLGVHRDVKAGRMVSWEFLRIDGAPDGALTYFASPRSAAPTPFRLVEQAAERVVFENKKHDFPQRILYWRDGAGALHARIEGVVGGKTRAREWVWTKVPAR
jgi:hypothetical protein